MTIRYFQPVNLTFQVAYDSDGINDNYASVQPVFQFDLTGASVVQQNRARRLEGFPLQQIFVLDLNYATVNTSGTYIICTFANFLS